MRPLLWASRQHKTNPIIGKPVTPVPRHRTLNRQAASRRAASTRAHHG